MNTPDLSHMNDIIVPTFQASFWPLALGYWLLILLVFILCIGFVWWFKRHRKVYQAMYEALQELKKIPSIDSKQANVLLKRVAIHYHGRDTIASLADEKWIHQLKLWTPVKQQDQLEQLFAKRYQLHTDETTRTQPDQEIKKMLSQIIRRCSRSKRTPHAFV
tara:strand:+ start:1344 stop:1829 length:486 start_codon:yes stop_codon:yes gene_type:complete